MKRVVVIAPFLLATLFAGCVHKTHALREVLQSYSGDGIITDTSIASPLFRSPGFRIEFPEFSALSNYEASYRLTGIPATKDKTSTILLRFESPDCQAYEQKARVTASFRFKISNESGVILYVEDLPIGNAIWASSGSWFGIYDSAKSEFRFDSRTSYTLHVVYIAGDVPPPAESLFVTIENGGIK
jgi:hypothetical protein